MGNAERVPVWAQATGGVSTIRSVLPSPSELAGDRRLGALIVEAERTRTNPGRSNLVAPAHWLLVLGGAALLAFAPVDLPRLAPGTVPVVQLAPVAQGVTSSRQRAAPVQALRWIETATGLSKARIGRLIRASRPTIDAWEDGGPIRDSNRRRLLAVQAVLELAWQRAPSQPDIATWLDTPRGADGVTPAEMIERGELGRARFSALGNPPSGLKAPPPWVGEPLPEAFRGRREDAPEAVFQEHEGSPVSLDPAEAPFDGMLTVDQVPTLDL